MIMLDCEHDDELPDGASIVHPSPMRRAREPSQWESHIHRSGLQVCGQYVLIIKKKVLTLCESIAGPQNLEGSFATQPQTLHKSSPPS